MTAPQPEFSIVDATSTEIATATGLTNARGACRTLITEGQDDTLWIETPHGTLIERWYRDDGHIVAASSSLARRWERS